MTTKPEKDDPNEVSGTCLSDLLFAGKPYFDSWEDIPYWNCRNDKNTSSSSGPQGRLEEFMSQHGNKFCADCGAADPKWVSLCLGAIVCIKCSGVHRSLGVHITKVFSVNLDDWTDEQVDHLVDLGGNDAINLKYESCLPDNVKLRPDSSSDVRSDFIRRKYVKQDFMYSEEQMSCPFQPNHNDSNSTQCESSSNVTTAQDKKLFDKQPTRHRIGSAFRNSWGRKELDHKTYKKKHSMAGMVEFVGLIKVNVVKGTNLAVRDMVSSDPYVLLSLGQQSVKTRVIKSSLNPVWNEKLMLSIPDNVPPLKVVVYDKDTFTTDDFMGEAEIDIQPLLSAAKASENSSISEPMQMGKWRASKDNTLLEDSVILMADGKIKQNITLKLQKVERGELQIELECVPLSQ